MNLWTVGYNSLNMITILQKTLFLILEYLPCHTAYPDSRGYTHLEPFWPVQQDQCWLHMNSYLYRHHYCVSWKVKEASLRSTRLDNRIRSSKVFLASLRKNRTNRRLRPLKFNSLFENNPSLMLKVSVCTFEWLYSCYYHEVLSLA